MAHFWRKWLCRNSLFLGIIPVLVIARQVKVNLSRLQLGLLYTKEIRIYTVKKSRKPFWTHARSPFTFHDINFMS